MMTRSRMFRLLALGLVLAGCSASRDNGDDQRGSELVGTAPDATGRGPLATTSAEYRFDPAVDTDVLEDRPTEIWGSVFRPQTLATGEKHPVLVFLHGNHGTCGRGSAPRIDDNVQYTTEGTCPDGYTVVPNHRGYDYIAERLASWGYVVVSINANRGITAAQGVDGDFGLNLARGRLVLRHLELLSQWNAQPGTTPASLGVDLAGMLDFDQVGLMGHSRGGEGVRAAYNQYLDPGSVWPARIKAPVTVRGIFEVGPVDGQTSRTLDAFGTAWNVLLPLCDGDVFTLDGMQPFDRMSLRGSEANPTTKSMFAVWGANHNYFNTEWQQSDSKGCSGAGNTALFALSGVAGSAKQQETGLHAMMAFFRAHVGKDANAEYVKVFDPQYGVASSLSSITRVERVFADAVSEDFALTVEDFAGADGMGKAGLPNTATNVTVTHTDVSEHESALKAAKINWTAPGGQYQVNLAAAGAGIDVSAKDTLDFRVSRQRDTVHPEVPVNFSVQLVRADDSVSSPVPLKEFLELLGPVGARLPQWNCNEEVCHPHTVIRPGPGHLVLDTVRIPLSSFGGSMANVRAVRFVFDDTPASGIFLSSLRFSKGVGPIARPTKNTAPLPVADDAPGAGGSPVITAGNQVRGMKQAAPNAPLEIEVESTTAFPVTNDFVRLRIGNRDTVVSRYPSNGDTHRLVFRLKPEEVAATQDGAPMKVRYGADLAKTEYDFGTFKKSDVNR
jgi:hypothetical protein